MPALPLHTPDIGLFLEDRTFGSVCHVTDYVPLEWLAKGTKNSSKIVAITKIQTSEALTYGYGFLPYRVAVWHDDSYVIFSLFYTGTSGILVQT